MRSPYLGYQKVKEEFERQADLYTQHRWKHTPTIEEHMKVRISFMAMEICNLRSERNRLRKELEQLKQEPTIK
jgi:hypothetical protein